LDRNEALFRALAEAQGHELDFHPGHVGGRGADVLRRAVERAELVVIVTDLNSHGAVQGARAAARRFDRPVLLLRKCGAARFQTLLDAISLREQRIQHVA
jgi:hypothetical protein